MTYAEFESFRRENKVPWKTKPCRECSRERPSDEVYCGICNACAEEMERQRAQAKLAWAKHLDFEAQARELRGLSRLAAEAGLDAPPNTVCYLCRIDINALKWSRSADGTYTHVACAAQASREG